MNGTGRRTVAALLAAICFVACEPGPGDRPEDVRAVVERAVAAWQARDFDAMVATYTGQQAGRYRDELQMVHGGDEAAFFTSKRRMVVIGPVNIRRQAFATVRVIILHQSGHKPYDQVQTVFRDGAWHIDALLPGDVLAPRVDRARPNGIIGLLHDSAEAARLGETDGTFSRLQTIRAIEVVAVRRLVEAAAPLIELMQVGKNASIRQFAASTLGRLGDADAVTALQGALVDDDLRVRADAATSLAQLGAGDALPALRELAGQDPRPWVRETAAAAVASLEQRRPPE